uniref:Putative secreted protein n=1 Tax=Anopheles darlingi TaxID=43151 RepID=A0A2M4D2P8_ANODA
MISSSLNATPLRLRFLFLALYAPPLLLPGPPPGPPGPPAPAPLSSAMPNIDMRRLCAVLYSVRLSNSVWLSGSPRKVPSLVSIIGMSSMMLVRDPTVGRSRRM